MANTTINIIDSDTFANLTANEPYVADSYHQLVYATDTSEIHRILDDGTLSDNILAHPVELFTGVTDWSANFYGLPLKGVRTDDGQYEAFVGVDSANGYAAYMTVYDTLGTQVSTVELNNNGAAMLGENITLETSDYGKVNINSSGFKIANSTGQVNFKGVEYNADYSADFTDRSLVDKEYVDGLNGIYSGSGVIPLGTIASSTHRPGDASLRTNFGFGIDIGSNQYATIFASQADDGVVAFGHQVNDTTGNTTRSYLTLQKGTATTNLEHNVLDYIDTGTRFGIDFSSGNPEWITNLDRVAIPNIQPASNNSVWTVDTDGSATWELLPVVPAAQNLSLSGTQDPTLLISGGSANIDLQGTDGVVVENQGGNLNIGIEAVAATATGDVVEFDQWVENHTAIRTSIGVADYVHTPLTSFAEETLIANYFVDTITMGTKHYTGQIVYVEYPISKSGLATFEERIFINSYPTGAGGVWIHPGETIKFRAFGNFWEDTLIYSPDQTVEIEITATADIHPQRNALYIVDAENAAGAITLNINNDHPSSTVKTFNSVGIGEAFYIKIFGADVNTVTIDGFTDDSPTHQTKFRYKSLTITDTITITDAYLYLKVVKNAIFGAGEGYEIYAN